ncbi:hypothetical protein BDN71DRAFT_1510948 [Pleurotus eryngii]|uniref:Uncharacterized protein n=1 Tax=Pleurotus eryngii TaxID=5323 RepID=A0A9P5ZM24_PLEER|nr:hypothetical protein BDN71DRAFT_1510948 [Pleurotus eryngii]
MASHTTHTLQTTAAALRWAGSFVDISPLALPSPEHELTDPMRGALTAVPRSHPPPDQHLPSSPSLFHHQRHPSFPTSPSATSASASSSSNTPSAPSSHGHHSSGIYTPGGSRARLSSFWEDVLPQQNLDDVPEDAPPATDYFSPSHLQLSQPQPRARPRLLSNSGSSNNPTPTSSSTNSASSSTSTLTTATLTTSPTTSAIPIPIPNFPLLSPALRRPSHSISLSDNPLPSASRRAHLTRQSSSPLPQPVQPSPHHLSLSLTGGELGSQGSHGIPLHLQQILADQRTRNDDSTRIVQTQSPVPFNGDDVSGNDSDVVDENEYALDTDSTDTDSNGDGEHANARVTGAPGPDSVIVFPSMTEARSTSTLLPALPVAEREGEERGSKEGKGKEKYREGGGDGERKDVEKDKQEEGEKEKEQANGSVGEGGDDNLEGQRDAESGTKDADGNTSIFASPVPTTNPSANIPPINSTTTPMNILSVPNIHTMNIPTASLASYLSLGYLPAPSPPDELERRRALYKFNILHTPPSFPSTTTTSSASASNHISTAHSANYTNPVHSSSLPGPPSSSSLPNSTSTSNTSANMDARSVDNTGRTLEGGRDTIRDHRDNKDNRERERDGGRVVERDRNGDRLVDRSTEPFSRIAHLSKLVFATKGVGVGCIDGGEQ